VIGKPKVATVLIGISAMEQDSTKGPLSAAALDCLLQLRANRAAAAGSWSAFQTQQPADTPMASLRDGVYNTMVSC
jgi:hypothetical protein